MYWFKIRPASIQETENLITTDQSATNQNMGPTDFIGEAQPKTAMREDYHDVPRGILESAISGPTQNIKDFLQRPLELTQYSWNSTAVAGSIAFFVDIFEDLITKPMYAEKVRGFMGIRAKTIIRVQANSNKFQAGRMLIVFIPQAQVSGVMAVGRIRSLTAATQLPRIELDLATESEVIMEIPYISPTPYYDMVRDDGPCGRLYGLIYSPLRSGPASEDVSVTVWGHLEDVELVTPVLVPQSGRMIKRKKNKADEEAKAMGVGLVSGTLSTLSGVASSFAQVPTLSAIAGTASWVLEAASGVAAAFGYSKPLSESPTDKFRPFGNFNMQNFNGVDINPNMGLDATNKLDVIPGYAGTDVDEMTLSHLMQIPAYVQTVSWTKASPPGALIYTSVVAPWTFRETGVYPSLISWSDYTPLSYFSQFFDLYRGSIVFTLKCVKTTFHSGRLVFVFNPAPFGSFLLDDTPFAYREILDIRENSEFRFTVPYARVQQYLRRTSTVSDENALGYVKIFVINSLVSPDTVSPDIEILVEVGGGPDIEVALPAPRQLNVVAQDNWVSQSGMPLFNDKPVGNSDVSNHTLHAAQYCIGEKANSILQLMKRYTRCECEFENTPGSTSVIIMRPFLTGATTQDAGEFATTCLSDYLTLFSLCFAYARGSVRVMYVPDSQKFFGPGWLAIAPTTVPTPYTRTGQATLETPLQASHYWNGEEFPARGVNIPPYQKLHARLVRPTTPSRIEPVDIYTSSMVFKFPIRDKANIASITRVYRAAGDDFSLGFFLGTPRVTDKPPSWS